IILDNLTCTQDITTYSEHLLLCFTTSTGKYLLNCVRFNRFHNENHQFFFSSEKTSTLTCQILNSYFCFATCGSNCWLITCE
ncbi:unnamed protein product, partial [Tenebrio molitor]